MEWRLDFSLGKDFVQHDIVVGRAGSALNSLVRLLEEVPVARLCDAAIDHGATHGIAVGAVGFGNSRRIETGVVALTNDDDGDVREVMIYVHLCD